MLIYGIWLKFKRQISNSFGEEQLLLLNKTKGNILSHFVRNLKCIYASCVMLLDTPQKRISAFKRTKSVIFYSVSLILCWFWLFIFCTFRFIYALAYSKHCEMVLQIALKLNANLGRKFAIREFTRMNVCTVTAMTLELKLFRVIRPMYICMPILYAI